MRKIGSDIGQAIAEMGGNAEEARINMRVHEVRDRYRAAIESVYPAETAKLHLAHTNNVIIMKKDDKRKLVVYVDDSLFAAELNAQRELIKLQLLMLFGEEIDDFQIAVSKWRKYREHHPYLSEDEETGEGSNTPAPSIPLNEREKSYVAETASRIEDERLRKSLEKAMTADMEWKKGENMESGRKNTK